MAQAGRRRATLVLVRSDQRGALTDLAWREYIDRFHAERAGVTEAVFGHLEGGSAAVHRWVQEAIPAPGAVLDVACGSAPMVGELTGGWVGVDRVTAELALARRRGAPRVVVGDASALPVRDVSFDTVVCSMALMLLQPLDRALREMTRVLRPGGRLVALAPDARPLTLRNRARYARLLVALRRRRIGYPNDLAGVDVALRAAGLELISDDRRRFACRIDRPETATLFVESLYLPSVDPDRLAAANTVAQRWVGTTIGIPLRRLVAVASG